ncbi:uncharacterized protein LOC131604499 [Vicia villosa]|uniref:uncharacterized protein LOC131604499 n=1 Tax=Vicia villosa TaxID=3911 RepID=UPI00273A83FB|nr:uncharacterized protein LOC131604499 [Vicia villosa]
MATTSNDRLPSNLPILDSKNYDKWVKQMKVLFGYQGVLDVIKNGVTPLTAEATSAHKAAFKEEKKNDYKALFLIHSRVDGDNFEKVGDCSSAKEAWDILEKAYVRADKAKVVRLQTHKRQLELMKMEEKESICDYVTRVTRLVNQIKSCGKAMEEKSIVSKILRSLTPRFDNIVVALEESKDLEKLSKNDLPSSLEAHEKRMDERGNDKAKAEIALQARLKEKNNHSNEKWQPRGKGYGGKDPQNPKAQMGHKDEGCSKGGGQGTRKECNAKPKEKQIDEAEVARHEAKVVKINRATKNKVKFAEDTTLEADGVSDVLIMKRDCGHSLIKDVLFIPGIKCNLLSIGELLKKNYTIRIENKSLRVLDQNGVLVLKEPMDAYRTFKIALKVMEHRCLDISASREECLWNYRLGNLNF